MHAALVATFWVAVILAAVPLVIHGAMSVLTGFNHFLKEDLFVDLVLFGLAITIGGFVDGLRLRSLGKLGADELKVTILVGVFPVGIAFISILYSLAVAKLVEFDWQIWLSSAVMVAVFCFGAYLLSVNYASNAHKRR